MSYRMTVRSNPKLLVVPGVVVALLAVAISLFSVGPVLGIIALAVGGYLSWTLVRFIRKQLQCSVDVVEEGVVLDLYGEEKVTAPWDRISHLGTAVDTRGRKSVFLYREAEDKLLVIPDEFERFGEIVTRIRESSLATAPERTFHEISLGLGESVKDRLRTIVGRPRVVDEEAEDGAAEGPTPPP